MVHRDDDSKNDSNRKAVRVCKSITLFLALSLFTVACARSTPPLPTIYISAKTLTPVLMGTATPSPTSTLLPSPTPSPLSIWLAPYLPEKMRAAIVLPDGYRLADTQEGADFTLALASKDMPYTSQWIYALVAPFPTIPDGITTDELMEAWNGDPPASFNSAPLLIDQSTLDVLSAYWGPPAHEAVQVLPADQLLEGAWSNRPSWGIIPFENLVPQWKVLTLDSQSPVHKDFDPSTYHLTIPFLLSSSEGIQPVQLNIPSTNREASKLTTVALTGVTAMVRATAFTMELRGVTYPAEDIGPLLSDADITHISNEIPFSPDCPYPTPTMDNLVFCSRPKYIDLLKAVGTDIVELTGDHFMDQGADATLYTLQMYKDLGWPYYGGGANATEAGQPVLLENNGNRIAFMGCNVGCQIKPEIPCDAIATDQHPGAAQCDFNWINSKIPTLREQGYQVIFTFQHREYYTYTAPAELVKDFGKVAAAGATIVSGSQAHQPHGFSFEAGAYIHYGLGNLFFDQFHYCGAYACDDAFIDRHVFYDGRYISTELITIRFVDFARPRLMTPAERTHFLDTIFKASGW